ncbi:uncharacterized protein BDR25DRAFT_361327 [Lindgomyces ingoldianus]|uniref:Uncharacterized protein n=1 Tax=Lindgomyces ingoldianus TaxID=673940 RepID=A0ACB6QD56_9PLEO|nr:uncharacterized protein BDR25DRAFT_361327 [Lindgomyces ingoldianus]KAF2464790.1 hypothetical protein BDR25DRAFT_361327 [Lindgomyces ingoldianus]
MPLPKMIANFHHSRAEASPARYIATPLPKPQRGHLRTAHRQLRKKPQRLRVRLIIPPIAKITKCLGEVTGVETQRQRDAWVSECHSPIRFIDLTISGDPSRVENGGRTPEGGYGHNSERSTRPSLYRRRDTIAQSNVPTPTTAMDLQAYHDEVRKTHRFRNGDGKVNPGKYGSTLEFDLGLCYTTFCTGKFCEFGLLCPYRHHPLTRQEMDWIASLWCESFARFAAAKWSTPEPAQPTVLMAAYVAKNQEHVRGLHNWRDHEHSHAKDESLMRRSARSPAPSSIQARRMYTARNIATYTQGPVLPGVENTVIRLVIGMPWIGIVARVPTIMDDLLNDTEERKSERYDLGGEQMLALEDF